MDRATFAEALALYGPKGCAPPVTPSQADAYCRELARSHYENFTVMGWFLPKEARPHVARIYAYCRWADDLADETTSPEIALELLDWWREELHACYRGQARHPVFVALHDTIRAYNIPSEPFENLLVAFRQDQRLTRYSTREELLGYCRNSADPVGRLVLYLARGADDRNNAYSDAICSGLQVANFCQDVAQDWDRGRIYIPAEMQRRHGYDEGCFARREYNDAFAAMMREMVDWSEALLQRGEPLSGHLPQGWGKSIELFRRGGLAVLEAIRGRRYDVWSSRPRVSKWRKFTLAIGCLLSPLNQSSSVSDFTPLSRVEKTGTRAESGETR